MSDELPSAGQQRGRNKTHRGRGGGFRGRGRPRGSHSRYDVQNGRESQGGAHGGSLPRKTEKNEYENTEVFGLGHHQASSEERWRGSSGRGKYHRTSNRKSGRNERDIESVSHDSSHVQGESRGGWQKGRGRARGRGRGTWRGGKRGNHNSVADPQLDCESLLLMLEKDPDELVKDLTSDSHLPAFESLLDQIDLPDKDVIVILKVLEKACDSQTSRAFLIILLNKLVSSLYLSSALTRYINCLAYALRDDQRDIQDELKCMIKVFTEVLNRMPTSFPHLPLANLFHATTALEDSGQPIDEDIKSSVQNLITLRDQMAEKVKNEVEETANNPKRRRRPRDDAALLDNEDPPNNYRCLSVIPRQDDIHPNGPVFFRRNKVEGSYDGPEHYLDVQFRLLREDFIRPLREGIAALSERNGIGRKQTQDIRIYNDVEIIDEGYTSKGVQYTISFDVSAGLRHVKWENSKRLIYGSLLCLSKDNFETFILATVEERKPFDLRRGILKVKFKNVYEGLEDKLYQMVETTAYFEAYCHVLKGLQVIIPHHFPFERYIVKSEPDVQAPFYLRRQNAGEVTYDMSCIMKKKNSPSGRCKAKGEAVRILDMDSWPSAEDLELDSSQLKAVQLALTKEFAIIQGPPGTGKTYIGLKVAKVLLENKSCWNNITKYLDPEEYDNHWLTRRYQSTRPVLVVCYTNHALDQFLEGIHEFHPKGIVRVGGRSQSEKMQACSLRIIKENIREHHKAKRGVRGKYAGTSHPIPNIDPQFMKAYDEQRGIRQKIFETHQELESISKKMEGLKYKTQELKTKVISEKKLHGKNAMSRKHYQSIVGRFKDVEKMGVPVKPSAMHYWLELLTNKFDFFRSGDFVKPAAVYPLTKANNSSLNLETGNVKSALGPDDDDDGSSLLRSDSYILIPNRKSSSLDTRFSITILLHYYPMSRGGVWPIITFHDQRSGFVGIQISQVPNGNGKGALCATFHSRYEEIKPSQPVVTDGILNTYKWNYIGLTYDYRSAVLRLWHDGIVVGEHHFHPRIEIPSHLPVCIGTTKRQVLPLHKGDPTPERLGKVSDLQFYPQAIKQEQILAMAGISKEDQLEPQRERVQVMMQFENDANLEDEEETDGESKVLFEANALEDLRMLDTEEVEHFGVIEKQSQEAKEAPFNLPHDNDGGWQIQTSKRKLKRFITREINKKDKMTDKEVNKINDVWALSKQDRWRLYRYWIKKLRQHYKGQARMCYYGFEECAETFKHLQNQQDLTILTKATIIGMTTTGAAKYRPILQQVKPRIIIVEEAAEVLESHIVTSLNPGCQHLILIGDHKQLRPSPNVYDLAKDYKLDVSLFERMVDNGMDYQMLRKQHRMRPEIARLMEPIYENLENHESVMSFENIKGVNKNIFFIDHNQLEEFVQEGMSRSNLHEAKYLAALCRYFILQGYDQGKITILTMYVGQLLKLKKETKDEIFKGVRICAVDNFQGEENDIILLSLVRSNEEGNIGFLRISNRVCVALSRARKGFYCIGNLELMCAKEKLWDQIITDMKERGNVGQCLTLMCQNHPKTIIQASLANDFLKAPEGGCMLPCHARLDCGHACRLSCHPRDPDHIEYECLEPCTKTLCDLGHKCKKKCYEDCGPCMVPMEKMFPQCNHVVELPCHLDPAKENCPVPCEVMLNCGHQCQGSCHECFKGRLHKKCEHQCEQILVCGHLRLEICAIKCPSCSQECKNECPHKKCNKKCGEPCEPCEKKCTWKCLHYRCTKPCSAPCNRPRCNKPCRKTLSCGHQCIGMCGEPCPKKCRVCHKDDVGCNDDPDARFVELKPCKHVVEVKAMDTLMDECCNGLEKMKNRLKRCPVCDEPVRCCPRYGNIIKADLQDIEKVKAELFDPGFDIQKEAQKIKSRISFKGKFLESFRRIQSLEKPALTKEDVQMLHNEVSLLTLLNRMLEEIDAFSQHVKDNAKVKKPLVNEVMALKARGEGNLSRIGSLQPRRKYQFSDQEKEEMRDEILRVQLMVSYRLLNVVVQKSELTLSSADKEDMNAIGQAIDSGRRIGEKMLDSHIETLDKIRKSYVTTMPWEGALIKREDTLKITNSIGLLARELEQTSEEDIVNYESTFEDQASEGTTHFSPRGHVTTKKHSRKNLKMPPS